MSRRIGMGANKELDEKAKLKQENKALTEKVKALNAEKEKALKEIEELKKKIKE